ncbi:MAG: class B sortase [Eggerthellaceae bacterium]|nr:class B sortase [Eggerthellaceae bacterium]
MADAQHYPAPYPPNLAPPRAKKGGRKKSILWRIVFWLSLAVFLCSLSALGVIGYDYLKGQVMYRDIASWGFVPPADVDDTSIGATLSGQPLADVVVDWNTLREKNPDTVGWIYIPGTVVNYPIVQGRDNYKYLTVDFLGGQGRVVRLGSIFLAAENSPDFSDPNNIVYGHHMQDGSMFACIDGFMDQAQFDAHRTVYVFTPTANYRLTTFSLVIANGSDPIAQPRFSDPEDMARYFQDKINRSVVRVGPDAIAAEDITKCFALVTCDFTIYDGRAVLFASVVETAAPSAFPGSSNPGLGGLAEGDLAAIDDATKELQ